METPLINHTYLIQKFEEKGGWTYVEIPEISPDRKAPFGWVQVRGMIDDYELKPYRLLPMGKGKMFLPLKAEIRKKIKKGAGDWVHIVLYLDDTPYVVPEAFLGCLLDAPRANAFFHTLTESHQRFYTDWIYEVITYLKNLLKYPATSYDNDKSLDCCL